MSFASVIREVKEDNAETHEADERGDYKHDKGNISKGRPVDERSGFWCFDAHLHNCDRDEQSAERDECYDSNGPGESDPINETIQDDWVDDAADGRARRSHTHRQADSGAKVRRKDGHGRYEKTARADAHAEPLREQHLPVLRAETQHHVSEHDAKVADD